ncbi:MAG: hypothetical protein WBP40_04690 [Candidatus Moraniibacteriota bacterium]
MEINRYQCGVYVGKVMGKSRDYIPAECKKLVYDWYQLKEIAKNFKDESSFFDWSFIIVPMSKAIEGILISLAKDLGLDKEDNIVGNFFDTPNIEKNFQNIEEKIIEKGLSSKQKEDIKGQLAELKNFLKRYRHVPSHYGSFFKSYEQAEAAGISGLHNIGCVLNELLQAGVVSIPESEILKLEDDEIPTLNLDDLESEKEVRLEDIPF